MVSYLSTHLPQDGVCPGFMGGRVHMVLCYSILCGIDSGSYLLETPSEGNYEGGLSQTCLVLALSSLTI